MVSSRAAPKDAANRHSQAFKIALHSSRIDARPGVQMEDVRREYAEAFEAWQEQLRALHRVLLGGERMEPPKLKGLLNREARAKERYDVARRRLLGISE